MLEKLVSVRPAESRMTGSLYLRPLRKPKPTLWYSTQPVGEAKIKQFMKVIAEKAGLSGKGKRYTNHSVRKTLVRKLQKGGISNDKITAITGHKSEQSIAYYAATDLDDHQSISHIISKDQRQHEPPTSALDIQLPPRQPLQPLPLFGENNSSRPAFVFTGCTVNICARNDQQQQSSECIPKKRRVFIESDEDD